MARGVAAAFLRPDDRLFVAHRLSAETAFGPLLDAAIDDLDQPIHLSIANDQAGSTGSPKSRPA